ncbi:protein MAIN-LIKE 2-like [Arachis hypogaea]|uniref:protein MAIN-LIKE 2-like n=1 Tax=Arachis hypogaea TaxID=3818 RepID=UPI003B21B11B
MYHEHATTAGYAPGREDRSILAYAGLYHLARLNESWFRLDEPLVSAFVERWRPKIHTFQMSFGEYMITLHDVVYQLGLPIDGHYETLGELSDGADEPTVRRYARAYIMMLLENQLFGDKSSTRIHIRWLPYVARLEDMGGYNWGSAALLWWSGHNSTASEKGPRVASWRLRIDLF